LFGGCFIKAEDAQSLGNTAEADVEHWASSIEAVEKKFPDAESVVPGHGEAGDRSLLAHTSRLVSSALLNP
jgi:metallo-beta-lactamase class B